MKRDRSLIAFSREHHVALRVARDLHACAEADGPWLDRHWPAIRSALGAYWQEDVQAHFAAEERDFPWARLDPSWMASLLRDHRDIEALFERARAGEAPSVRVLGSLSSRLKHHVRWEETELFPAVERVAPDLADFLAHEETRASPRWSIPTPGTRAARRLAARRSMGRTS